MDITQLITELGFPIVITLAFGWYITKRTSFVEETLMRELDVDFKRLEGIIIALISQIKLAQLDLKHLKGYVKGLEDIITKLLNKEKK